MLNFKSRAWAYLAIVFPLSWALWIPVMIDKANPVFLDLSGGPALAAMWAVSRHDGNRGSPARLLAFGVFILVAWLLATLNVALNSTLQRRCISIRGFCYCPGDIRSWILSGAFSSDTAVRSLLRGVVKPPNWRWPIIALLILPAFLGATALMGRALGLPVGFPARGLTAVQMSGLAAIRFFHYLLFGSAFEEPGWRGFLLPQLQTSFSPLMASVLVWLPWAVWHLPLDIHRPRWGPAVILQNRRRRAAQIFSILITWVYNRSGCGLLSAFIFHAAIGSFPFILPSSAPLLVPVAIVLLIAAVVSDRSSGGAGHPER